MADTFLWNFIKIRSVVSEKMFKEKAHGRTHNRPWHKLAGLQPVELKSRGSSAARTQDPWITSQTLYRWATQDPF